MARYPKVQLSRLRQIGWDHWDPIGIRSFGYDDWKSDAADEYDRYILHVVSMLHSGRTPEQAVTYLNWVGSEYMGLGAITTEANLASVATVDAILEYLKSMPDGPLHHPRSS